MYNGPASGDDVVSRIAVEDRGGIQPGQSRRIWTTGTSRGISTGDDWATQFNRESYDP